MAFPSRGAQQVCPSSGVTSQPIHGKLYTTMTGLPIPHKNTPPLKKKILSKTHTKFYKSNNTNSKKKIKRRK
jgi:hypothetical protein